MNEGPAVDRQEEKKDTIEIQMVCFLNTISELEDITDKLVGPVPENEAKSGAVASVDTLSLFLDNLPERICALNARIASVRVRLIQGLIN